MSSATDVDVLVLGASFAGIELVYQLRRQSRGAMPSVAVVDRQQRHAYLPLVHERLCARLAEPHAMLETARYVDGIPGGRFVLGEVERLDPDTGIATLGDGRTLQGRVVVVALGSVVTPPPRLARGGALLTHKLADEYAEARAALEGVLTRPSSSAPMVLVVGAGITGVELAAELADLVRVRPPGWSAPHVTLVDPAAVPVSSLHPRIGPVVARALIAAGIDLRLGTGLVERHAEGAVLREADGTVLELPCALAFWCGGIRPAPVLEALGLPRGADGFLEVAPTLRCFPTGQGARARVFACGDAVRIVGDGGRWPTLQRAIEAIWQAKVAARNVLATLRAGEGTPALAVHRLVQDFPYGISLGARSYVAYGPALLRSSGVNLWFRRFLMRRYLARYCSKQ